MVGGVEGVCCSGVAGGRGRGRACACGAPAHFASTAGRRRSLARGAWCRGGRWPGRSRLRSRVVVELEPLGLRQRPLEVVLWGVGGNIQQRAVHRRCWNPFMAGGVPGIEATRTVQADPRDPSPGRGGGHLRARRVVAQEVPVDRGADVAEHRVVPHASTAASQRPSRGTTGAPPHRRRDGRCAAAPPSPAARSPSAVARGPATAPPTPPPLPRSQLCDRHVGGCCVRSAYRNQCSTPPEHPRPPATADPANAPTLPKHSHPPMPKKCRRGRVQSPPPAWVMSLGHQLHAPSGPGSANDGSAAAASVVAGTVKGAAAL